MKKMYPESTAPVYEITFSDDDNSGIRLVSLVKDPAIEVNGMFFNKEMKDYGFKNIKEKQMIVGPGMIPDMRIPRKDDDGDLYFVFFSKDTIKELVNKFNRNNTGKSINIEHSSTMAPAFISQNWIVEDSYYDKSKMYGFNLPVGSWFIECKVEDKEFWDKSVKEDGLFSFSIEGLLGQKPSNMNKIDLLTDDEITEIINSL